MHKNSESHVSCLYTLDQEVTSRMYEIPLQGYRNSRPVQIGNDAADQFQMDAEGNILLTFKLIYDKYGERVHGKRYVNWQTSFVKIGSAKKMAFGKKIH